MEADMQATFDNCNNFNTKLQDTLKGLINANADRKSEIDSLRNDHEDLKKVFAFSSPFFRFLEMRYICRSMLLLSYFLFLCLGSRIISNKRRKRKWSPQKWNQIPRGEVPERQPGNIVHGHRFYFTVGRYIAYVISIIYYLHIS